MFAVISAVVLVLQYVTPFQRGFFCLDDTIVYPFKPSTISSTVLFIVSFAVPLFLVRLGEGESTCNVVQVGQLQRNPSQFETVKTILNFRTKLG